MGYHWFMNNRLGLKNQLVTAFSSIINVALLESDILDILDKSPASNAVFTHFAHYVVHPGTKIWTKVHKQRPFKPFPCATC